MSLKLIKHHQQLQKELSIYVNFAHNTDMEIFVPTLGLVDTQTMQQFSSIHGCQNGPGSLV
jgi:hypothetical protein